MKVLSPTLLFEDDQLLVLDKPAHLPVLGAQDSVAHWLGEKHFFLTQIGPLGENGLVHRLDNTTSGLLVVAKTQSVYERLRQIWNTSLVTKTYKALVLGATPLEFEIRTPIAHHPSNKKKMMVTASDPLSLKHKARPGITCCHRVHLYCQRSFDELSLLDVTIQTGVRHQIRVHLASIGHPLVGDSLYQNTKQRIKDTFKFNRIFLHLEKVTLEGLEQECRYAWQSFMPRELEEILDRIK